MLLATPPTCYNEPSGSIEFINVQNAELPITVSVDNQAFMPTGAIGNLFAGLHTAALQDAAGCTWQDTITIPNAPIFTVDAGSDTTITLGDSLRITATVQGVPVAYNWHCANHVLSNSAAVSTVITPTQNTICRCSVLDAKGCVATDSILIRIKEFNDIYIPNAFTPNGDGNNDVFAIYAGITVKEIKLLRIFDRYGELVYEKLNFAPNTATWDGVWARYKNDYIPPPFGGDGGIEFVTAKSRAPSAVYAVYTEIELLNGQTKHLSSDLTVIR